jgi:hypothetical protein
MPEHAEDLSPKTSRPVIGNKLPPVAIPPRPSPRRCKRLGIAATNERDIPRYAYS